MNCFDVLKKTKGESIWLSLSDGRSLCMYWYHINDQITEKTYFYRNNIVSQTAWDCNGVVTHKL